MGLNNITLTPQIVADLYSDVLVETNTTVVPGKAPIKFLGKNEKGILVIVNNPDVPFLHDDELKFLTSVLTACKLGVADVAIANWQQVATKNYIAIFEQSGSRHVLLFDVSPEDFGLPINFPHFQVQPFDQRTYLFRTALKDLEKNVETKKQLWNALKRFFAI